MSVHRDRDSWRVRWREHGRARSRTFTLKRDAEAFDREVKRRAQLGPLAVAQLTTAGPTLGEWIAEQWAPEHGATLARRTRELYARSYALHVAPWLDDVPLRELTVGRLRAWQAERIKAGVSASTLHNCRTLLSGVLRHAAEAEVVAANPILLVRPPRAAHREEVVPLAPATVERIRSILASPMPTPVPEGKRSDGRRRAYDMPDRRDPATRQRDAALVALLAYAGLRPQEAAALRWSDVRERTILVQRAAEEDGTPKPTKGRKSRSVRLLAPLAADLREWRLAAGRPPDKALVFAREDGQAWTKQDWGNWRSRAWRSACERADLEPVPRPYDLRHSFASLLLAEGRTVHYVAAQLGHGPDMTLGTYGHVVAEFEDAPRVDPETEIGKARGEACSARVPRVAS